MVRYSGGSSHQKIAHCGHEGMTVVSINTEVGCGVCDSHIVLRSPKCAMKKSATPFHHQQLKTFHVRHNEFMLS